MRLMEVFRGWSGGAKMLCILHHWGVQLILAYSWTRPAILVVGKGRGGMFLFLLFLHFHSCSSFFPASLSSPLLSLLSVFSLSLGDDTKWPSRVDVSLNPNTINQSIFKLHFFFFFFFLQNACVWARMVPEQGHLCHINTLLFFFSFFTFIHFPLSYLSLSFISSTILLSVSPFLLEDTNWPTRADRLETRRSRVQPLPRSATFFRGDWSWNIFYGYSLPSAGSRRAVISFWRKNVHNTA